MLTIVTENEVVEVGVCEEIKEEVKKVYGYIRVSTKGQANDGNSIENQRNQLAENGATEIFIDVFTGTKADRPELNKLLEVINYGDTIIVTKLDRIARSVTQGIEIIDSLTTRGVKVNVLNIGILDNTSMSSFMRNILLAFAQLERDLIVERTREGKEIARQRSDYSEGRKPSFTKTQLEYAVKLLNDYSYNEVVKRTKISKSTLIRYKRDQKAGITTVKRLD